MKICIPVTTDIDDGTDLTLTVYNDFNLLFPGALCVVSMRLIWCVKVAEGHVSGLRIVPCGEP